MIRQPGAKRARRLGPSRHLGAYALIAACIGLLFWPIWLLSYLFKGGPQPSEPFPQAGVDPSDDKRGSLGCESDG